MIKSILSILLFIQIFLSCDFFYKIDSEYNIQPELEIISKNTIGVNDSLELYVKVTDEDSVTIKYIWDISELHINDTILDNTMVIAFPKAGLFDVIITAIDNGGVVSIPDTLHITVYSSNPSIEIKPFPRYHPVNDSLGFSVVASDSDGVITNYMWSFDNVLFTTTKEPIYKTAWSDNDFGYKTLYVKALDDDNLVSTTDSFHFEITLSVPSCNLDGDTTIFVNDSFSTNVSANDSNGTILKFLWSLDHVLWDTTSNARFDKSWSIHESGFKNLYAKVIDDDGIISNIDTMNIHVSLSPPQVELPYDTTIFVNDTAFIRALGIDLNGSIEKYLWSLDNVNWDTTSNDTFTKMWSTNDDGLHVLYGKVIDNDGVVSDIDSISINVALSPPILFPQNDTVVAVNDTIQFFVFAGDSNGIIQHYLWSLDSGQNFLNTKDPTVKTIWPVDEHGSKMILVKAVDDDNLESVLDTINVLVNQYFPTVIAINNNGILQDTIIALNDSIQVSIDANDSNGHIVNYYWDFNANGWDDSTTSLSDIDYFKWPSGGNVPIIVGAKDDDGFMGLDTINVLFNQPPSSCDLNTNYNTGTSGWSDYNYLQEKGSIQVSFDGTDPDGAFDVLTYSFQWGEDQSNLTSLYSGTNSIVTVSNISVLTNYYWRLIAKDMYGDSLINSGTINLSNLPEHGIFWNLITDQAVIKSSSLAGANMASTSYDDKMWVFSGASNFNKSIYNSTNGIDWNLITDQAAITAETGSHHMTATTYDNKMWVITGAYDYNKTVYNSTDGIQWNVVTDQAEIKTGTLVGSNMTLTSFDGKMWLIAGAFNFDKSVYNSTDGIHWNLIADQVPIRSGTVLTANMTAINYDGKLWVITGASNLDKSVYNSIDGIHWDLVTDKAIIESTSYWGANMTATTHDDRIWVISGAYDFDKKVYVSGIE
ncbi:MAG: hypothetical protein OCD76_19330 [Reichenbachiella sp.]